MEVTVKGSSNILSMKSNSGGWGLVGLLNICELYGGLCHFKSRLFCFLKCEWNIGFKWLFHIFFEKNKLLRNKTEAFFTILRTVQGWLLVLTLCLLLVLHDIDICRFVVPSDVIIH